MEKEITFPTPIPGMLFPLPLSDDQIHRELAIFKDWAIVNYISKEKTPKPGTAIEKFFTFKSFERVIEFMNIIAAHVSVIEHHPEWENIWRTLRIRLSTWDIGHKVSNLDIELAKFIEEKYVDFASGKIPV